MNCCSTTYLVQTDVLIIKQITRYTKGRIMVKVEYLFISICMVSVKDLKIRNTYKL